jgi:uncharacterized DUF497 family protein
MKFEWDDAKNRQNLKKHGFDFADAEHLFTGDMPFFVSLDTQDDYGEDRWKVSGCWRELWLS